jgi:glycosyltransferase involved in cell wall biosynthesis
VTGQGALWAVIPAYNEAPTLREVALSTLRAVPRVVVVDDGSDDGTAAALAGLPLVLLRNRKNRGKAMSLWRGFRYASRHGASGVLTLDGDGQHAPEDIARLAARSRRLPGQLLIGARARPARRGHRARYCANRCADFWISWAAGYRIPDSQSGLRLYPSALLAVLRLPHGKARGFVFESEVLIEAARLGFQAHPVPVSARPRRGPRPSHFRPVLDVLRITVMVAGSLLRRGLYLQGLYRSLTRPAWPVDEPRPTLGPRKAVQGVSRVE